MFVPRFDRIICSRITIQYSIMNIPHFYWIWRHFSNIRIFKPTLFTNIKFFKINQIQDMFLWIRLLASFRIKEEFTNKCCNISNEQYLMFGFFHLFTYLVCIQSFFLLQRSMICISTCNKTKFSVNKYLNSLKQITLNFIMKVIMQMQIFQIVLTPESMASQTSRRSWASMS